MQTKIKFNKIISIIIIAIFMLSIVATIITIPDTTAAVHPYTVTTYCYVDVNPIPVGVGQEAFVTFGIDKSPMTVSNQYGDRWDNLTLTIGYPDGTTKTLTGFRSDATGFTYTTWTPDRIGNYTFQAHFLGEYLTGENPPPNGYSASMQAYIGDYYLPSDSTVVHIIVTEEHATRLPDNPLPTDYWQRPINMQNQYWNTISGNWFGLQAYTNAGYGYNMTGNYAPYTQVANAPHVIWTTPLAPGGLIGGEFGDSLDSNFYATAQYEPKFKEIIMNGVLYYTYTPISTSATYGVIAQNVKTGEILWKKDDMNGTLRMGQIWNYISPNQYGGQMFLWSTSGTGTRTAWSCYEATTGQWLLDITGSNVNTNGAFMMSPDGSILDYYIDTSNTSQYYLVCWNSSRALLAATGSIANWRFQPTKGMNVTWSRGIEWSVPIAMAVDGNPIRLSLSGPQSGGNIGISGNSVLMAYGETGNWATWQVDASYDLTDGHQNFVINRTISDAPWSRICTYTSGQGKYAQLITEGQYIALYNADTGSLVTKCHFPDGGNIWSYFASYRPIEAYGLLYQSTYDGHVYAWNANTGVLNWTWYAGDAGYNTVYGSYPGKIIELVADGKVILNQGHTYNPPMFRGSHAVAINATTGETVWKVNSFCQSNSPVVGAADGVLFLPNSYDNLLYAYGKGRSATTIEAPTTAVAVGASITIRGTVTDQSPGQTCLGIPAAGTPAISDAFMGEWMNYLYQQQPKPNNATGVPVILSVVDGNDNYREIGQVISDANGFYSFNWKPDIAGKYTVYALFAGSESYYSSNAVTAFTVDDVAPAESNEPQVSNPPTELYFAVSTAAIIIAIAVVGAVLLMAVKKRI
ncbi:MAG: PQQ-binding-like beta-propeller repeat protein [Nitrososphaerota archaeon]|jgi:outer membrane protein assembly factor BamB|nr:PQQ-binding-like beta-propeller repeat protein [Nitrososphaerota archaeon]